MRSLRPSGRERGALLDRILASALIGALGYAAMFAGVVSLAGQAEPARVADLAALQSRLPANAGYLHLIGRTKIVRGRSQGAVADLESAVRLNPLSAALWLDLARARLNVGDRDGAIAAAQVARARDATNARLCYDAAMVLLEAGSVGAGLSSLRCVADLTPARSIEVYDLAWAIIGDGDVVRAQVVPDTLEGWRSYAAYARGRRNDEVTAAWRGLNRWPITRDDRLDYIDYLAWFGKATEARALWTEEFGGDDGNLIYNGSFESEPVGRGLDWVLRDLEGTRTRIVRSRDPSWKAVLRVTFEGGNPDYDHAYQVVPVESGRRYALSASVRAERISSASGPRLFVRGYGGGCGMLSVDGRERKGTTSWERERLEFVPPPGCAVVKVGIRRASTDRLDARIFGHLDAAQFELSPVDGGRT